MSLEWRILQEKLGIRALGIATSKWSLWFLSNQISARIVLTTFDQIIWDLSFKSEPHCPIIWIIYICHPSILDNKLTAQSSERFYLLHSRSIELQIGLTITLFLCLICYLRSMPPTSIQVQKKKRKD